MITAALLREFLEYDPETGEWIWSNPPKHNARLCGKTAGYIGQDGYRRIRFSGISYKASRLAFLYMLGDWPANEVDHINRIRSDDKWLNLREATSSQNKYNRGDNALRGVYACNSGWWAMVGRGNYLGMFRTLEDAVIARDREALKLAGSFAILNTPLEVHV